VIRTSAAFVASLLVAANIAVDAQTAAVSVRPVASAGRTIHVTTTQDLSISASGLAGPGQLKMQSSGALAFTQINKAFNDQGLMDAEITIEKLEMTQALNGASADPRKAANAVDPVGQKVVATFDRTGKLSNVSAPKELEAHSAALRQLLGGAYALVIGIPEMPMTVGETRTVDTSALPLSLPGMPAGTPLPKVSLTLRAIDRVNGDRIARLTQDVESSGPANPLTITGTGTIDVNIDKGFVTSSEMNWNVDGSLRAPGANAAQPARVQATFKLAFNATE
jgi:hypothetical protein